MEITKRAVLYVGYPCNIKCKFCYFEHKKNKKWKSLIRVKTEAFLFRYLFGNKSVDFMGGEPTVYPKIKELISYCKKIGLRPSIITNGIVLSNEKRVESFKESGVYDYLVSIHGLEAAHDELVGLKNAFKIQKKALDNLNRKKIPIRVNVTLNKLNNKQLPEMAEYFKEIGAKVVNFICFNPFYEWEEIGMVDFQEKHSNIATKLKEAIIILEKAGIETNVRFFPLCMMKSFEKNQYNFAQLPYDSHEWDFMSWYNIRNPPRFLGFLFDKFILMKKKSPKESYLKQAKFSRNHHYKKGKKCEECSLTGICDGLTKQYYNRFGDSELKPYKGDLISDPTHFIKKQEKIVDD